MHPDTKRMKDAVAALGIPRRDIIARTDMGMTNATVFDPAHIALIAEHAGELVTDWLGVVIKRYPCGCVWSVRVLTDPRHAGRVDTKVTVPYGEHRCDDPAKPIVSFHAMKADGAPWMPVEVESLQGAAQRIGWSVALVTAGHVRLGGPAESGEYHVRRAILRALIDEAGIDHPVGLRE